MIRIKSLWFVDILRRSTHQKKNAAKCLRSHDDFLIVMDSDRPEHDVLSSKRGVSSPASE